MTIQHIGPIAIPLYGEDDEVIGYAPGWHYNVARSDLTPDLAPSEIDPGPTAPVVVWAGDEIDPETGRWRETAFLRFDTETEAQTALGIEP